MFKTVLAIDPDASPESQTLFQEWLERTYHGHHSRLPHVARLAARRSQQMIMRLEALHKAQGEQAIEHVPAELHALVCRGEHGASNSACVAQVVPIVDAATTLITSVLTWTILLLSQHQRVLDDVRHELQHELHGELPAADHVQATQDRLPLLDRVIKETLRLLPPHVLGLRYTAKRVELLGYELPAGTTVVYSPYLTHRLANFFVAPQRFRPERWLYIEPSAADYLPLGFEDESILPMPLLMKHVKLVLATLLQRAQLGLAAGVQVNVQLEPVLLPKSELPMVVTPMSRSLIQREVHGNIRKLVEFIPHH
jgi:cytochrome P450